MKYYLIIVALCIPSPVLFACSDQGGSYAQQGVKLEDAKGGDQLHDSALPNASPDTLPSDSSASPNGSSLGTSAIH